MPSGTRDAEWHAKRKSSRTKRSNFQVHPAGDGFWCMGTCSRVLPSSPKNPSGSGFWSWTTSKLPRTTSARLCVYDNLFGMMSLVSLSLHHDQILLLKRIANECYSSPCTRSCRLHRVWILVNSLLYERVSGVPMRRGMRSPLTCLVDERRV